LGRGVVYTQGLIAAIYCELERAGSSSDHANRCGCRSNALGSRCWALELL